MHTIIEFYNSSVGKKLLVGLTGIFLVTFLVIHLLGNLLLLKDDGGKAFDLYAEILPQVLIIRIVEIGLFLIILFHVVTAVYTWFLNKKARGSDPYKLQKKNEVSALSSRTMFLSGSIVYIFLVVHMRQFWYSSRYEAGEHYSMFEIVRTTLSEPLYVIFYLIAMFLLGFHLKHGFQSAFQTFGVRGQKSASLIEWTGAIFWLLLPLTFAFIPVYFLLYN